ncbi:probable tubulin polyglutamylase TTLL2 [Plutella xylostella]|nr:probable tubulin polyglutamylase TTLL2 [Plutella xylostella]
MEDDYDDDEPFIYRLNDNGTGPGLLIKICAERGWRLYQGYSGGEEKWNLWWRTSAFPAACYKALGDWQFMNHIPKGGSICRKDSLSRLLRCMRKIYGSIYDFSPPSYHLPLEYAKLVSECARLRRGEEAPGVVWIHKPVAQSQGRGIFLFRSVCEMRCGSAAVVQRYIERPLLIAGYKFDLRLYVCVPGYRPLTAYMYADGLARFGTDKYTLSDIHNPYRHLTNSSLNKTGPRYAECKDRIGSGCKWTLKQVRRALIGRWGVTEWLVWQRIRALVTLTLLAQAAGTPPAKNCFEFYGFDVLLDDTLKPWLIEVNLSPALASDCEADVTVKRPMLHELFDLLGLPMRHTGLALLQGPAQTTCSDEENASLPRPRTTKSPVVSAGRRGTRWRRRRTLPIHCVTLQPPMSDKFIETKEANGGRSSKSSSELSTDNSDEQSPSSSTTSSDPPEEPCRYTTAHRKRLSSAARSWGNGVRWDRAPGRTGQWVRIFPHVLPHDDQLGMEDIREGVAQVSKLTRAAREVARESARDPRPRDGARDAALDAALRDKLGFGPHFQVWLPPF